MLECISTTKYGGLMIQSFDRTQNNKPKLVDVDVLYPDGVSAEEAIERTKAANAAAQKAMEDAVYERAKEIFGRVPTHYEAVYTLVTGVLPTTIDILKEGIEHVKGDPT